MNEQDRKLQLALRLNQDKVRQSMDRSHKAQARFETIVTILAVVGIVILYSQL